MVITSVKNWQIGKGLVQVSHFQAGFFKVLYWKELNSKT